MPDRLASQGDRKVRLANPGRTLDQQRVSVGDPAAGGEVAHLLGVQRGLGGKVKPLQRALVRELRDPRAHLDTPLLAVRHLRPAQQRQRLAQ